MADKICKDITVDQLKPPPYRIPLTKGHNDISWFDIDIQPVERPTTSDGTGPFKRALHLNRCALARLHKKMKLKELNLRIREDNRLQVPGAAEKANKCVCPPNSCRKNEK